MEQSATTVYKILRPSEWEEAKANSAYLGSADDIRDGFIHFSTAKQMPGTANKYFTDTDEIYVLAFKPSVFPTEEMKWEKSRGDQLFPHLYGPLDVALAHIEKKLVRPADKDFDFSDIIGD